MKKLIWMDTMWMLLLAASLLSACLVFRHPVLTPSRRRSRCRSAASRARYREIQRLIDRAASTADASTAETSPLVLSLEEAIRVALSQSQLQIAAIDQNVAEALVPAARAKFRGSGLRRHRFHTARGCARRHHVARHDRRR
jgi:hypothetical protein